VVLQTAAGDRARPVAISTVTAQLDAESAEAVRQHALPEGNVLPGTTVSGYLFFPFDAYTRARVEVTDLESNEPEGFSIEL